jgi:transcription elongation factor Elf1
MSTRWQRLKARITGKVPYEKVGYFNGNCPYCGTHVGIDVILNQLTRQKSAKCAQCGKDIYDVISSKRK